MNEVNVLLANDPKFKFVEVIFAQPTELVTIKGLASKVYTYKTTLDLKEGDKVIVDSPNNGLVVVTVVGIKSILDLDHNEKIRYKWIVQKVDTEAYEQAKELEQKIQVKVNQAKAKLEMEAIQTAVLENMTEDDAAEVKKLVRL